MTLVEIKQVIRNLCSSYNRTPHSTIAFKTPNQVHRNLPDNSRQLLYENLDDVQEEVKKRAMEGHMKYLKVLEKRSEELYNKAQIVRIGQKVMVLAPRCAQNRISVRKNYMGAAEVVSQANNEVMFYVKWLHNGQSKKVRKDVTSDRPYSNQYDSFCS